MSACAACGGALTPERVLHHSMILKGVPVILIDSVTVAHCATCGESWTDIPDTEGLIAAIAVGRIMLPHKLSGTEIRFLRNAMGLTARELAASMEVREETISRWENGKEPVGPSSEKLLRLIAGDLLHEAAPAVSYDPQAVLNMRIQSARLSEQTVPMCLERVVFKSPTQGKGQRWDMALPEAA